MNATAHDEFASSLRGYGFFGVLATLIILLSGTIVLPNMLALPVGAFLVLAWVSLSHTPWQDIGYVAPRRWPLTVALAIIGGITLKLLMKSIVMPALGADPVNHAYHFLAGNRALLPNAILAMCVAGFAEETVFRGFLFERMQRLPRAATLLITSVLFAAAHLSSQGIAGAQQALVTGLVFGGVYALTRSIYPVMIAHAAFDLTALAIIYLDVEVRVAHFILR